MQVQQQGSYLLDRIAPSGAYYVLTNATFFPRRKPAQVVGVWRAMERYLHLSELFDQSRRDGH